MRLRTICVFAGSNGGIDAGYRAAAEALGRLLATRGIGVVYGGAKVGLMGAMADAALGAGGRVVGVIPEGLVAKEVAHLGLTQLHIVASMHERKALMASLSDGFVAVPGGWGTLEEWFEVLTWGQLGLHAKPCGLLNVRGYFDALLTFVDHSVREGFVRRDYLEMIAVGDEPGRLLDRMAAYQPRPITKWIEASTS